MHDYLAIASADSTARLCGALKDLCCGHLRAIWTALHTFHSIHQEITWALPASTDLEVTGCENWDGINSSRLQ